MAVLRIGVRSGMSARFCSIDVGLEYSDDQKVAWFSFSCWTAWAPPVPVWDRLHAMGIEVEADYQDEGGMNFEGAYSETARTSRTGPSSMKRRRCDDLEKSNYDYDEGYRAGMQKMREVGQQVWAQLLIHSPDLMTAG